MDLENIALKAYGRRTLINDQGGSEISFHLLGVLYYRPRGVVYQDIQITFTFDD